MSTIPPRQIQLYEALGYAVPLFGHVPMILGSDKARLSKRHGATSVMAYKEMGFLPEALVNYLVRLSWSHGDQEIFSLEELIDLFSLEAVGKSPAVFNPEKLLWLNQHYIKEYPLEKLVDCILPFWKKMDFNLTDRNFLGNIVTDLKIRSKTLVEMAEAGRFYFEDQVHYDAEAAGKFLKPEVADHLDKVVRRLPAWTDYTKSGIEQFLRALSEEQQIKLKVIAQPLRVALTGKTVSPGIDEVMITLGKNRVIERLQQALEYIKGSAA